MSEEQEFMAQERVGSEATVVFEAGLMLEKRLVMQALISFVYSLRGFVLP